MSEKQQRDEIRILCSASRRFGISMRVCAFCRIFTRTIYYIILFIDYNSSSLEHENRPSRRAAYYVQCIDIVSTLYAYMCVCV